MCNHDGAPQHDAEPLYDPWFEDEDQALDWEPEEASQDGVQEQR